MTDLSTHAADRPVGTAPRRLSLPHRRRPVHRRHGAAGQTYGVFLRSPYAHARIARSTRARPRQAPGVVQIFTGADLADAKVGGLPCGWLIHSKDGSPMKEPPHPVLAQGKVRHVGDQVALVVAETLLQAQGRRRADRGRLRGTAGGDRHHEVESAGSARARRRAEQRLLRLGTRQQGRCRCGVREGGERHEAGLHQQPPDPERDRAARGERAVHEARRQLHAVRREPEPARRAAADVRVRARPARVEGARDRARRRRRLRLEDLPVPRRDRAGVGEQAGRPTDQVDGRTQRVLPRRCARARPRRPTPSWRWTRRATSSRCA